MADVLDVTRKKLDSVSSCFCVAKWTSVTFHLESGTTHSCHHPRVHKVPLEELKENPAALHNTRYKIEQRKKMLAGERPSECEYCWNIEDLKTHELSDRILKSAADWSVREFDNVLKDGLSPVHKPRYVEVSFSKTCQFKCSYCSADYSSSWEEELKKYGPYPFGVGKKTNETLDEETNPYIKAFWEWWPELKPHLHTFRITGGEPLLSPNTFRILESLIAHPEPNMNLSVNSNLGAPEVLINKFVNMIQQIQEKKAIRRLDLFGSIDAYGARAEYIRNGLKHDYFWKNIERLLETSPTTNITLMCTFNALSVTSFADMMKKVFELNDRYRNPERLRPITVDIAYLRYPLHQTVKVLPDSYIGKMEKNVAIVENYIQANPQLADYYNLELVKIRRLLEWMKQGTPVKEKCRLQADFYRFFSEHDRRRKTDFVSTFPEMRFFWFQCWLQVCLQLLGGKVDHGYQVTFGKTIYWLYRVRTFLYESRTVLVRIFRAIVFNKLYYFSKYVLLEKIPKMMKRRN